MYHARFTALTRFQPLRFFKVFKLPFREIFRNTPNSEITHTPRNRLQKVGTPGMGLNPVG